MTSIYPYVPQIKKLYYCKKGHSHAQKPLNTVCLDTICRQNPLLCSTCVSQYHKYHKTTPLSTFLSDYQAAIKKNNIKQTKKRIGKQYQIILQNLQEFKQTIITKINDYIQNVNQYFNFLQKNLHIREQLQKTLNIRLNPKILSNSTLCDSQLSSSISFIIKNCLFSQQNRIINISSILKHDQSRNLALLDKITNQNNKYQIQISKCFQKLNFVKQTMKKQSINLKDRVNQFNNTNHNTLTDTINSNLIITDSQQFNNKQTMLQTLNLNKVELFSLKQKQNQRNLSTIFNIQRQIAVSKINYNPIFQFHERQKHQMLKIVDFDDKKSIIKSNITALRPQYGLICPSLDYQPKKQQNWSIKILNCRNFASKNTLAIGVCSSQSVCPNNFQQVSSSTLCNNIYLITSQGYIIKNGRQQRTDFRFSSGDSIHLKYDPYYRLLIIYKDNGNKITIKLDDHNSQQTNKLYGCVRLTYASDQVQLLNHTK